MPTRFVSRRRVSTHRGSARPVSTRIGMAGAAGLAGALALGLALGAGCAAGGPRWEREGSTAAELERDQNDCMSRATVFEDPGAPDPAARSRVQRDFENCMRARGWKKAERD